MTESSRLKHTNQSVIRVSQEEHNIIIVSDFHMSGGKHPESGKYRATENFYYDEEFARFIEYLMNNKGNFPWKLIINGDFLDVIRLTDYPSPGQYQHWEKLLKNLGIEKDIDDSDVSDHEKKFGLKTHEYKSIWKLDFIAQAHPAVFSALSHFVEQGNSLVVINGNHDVEFYWPKFQEMLVRILLRHLNVGPDSAKAGVISGRIAFAKTAYLIDNSIYIEHGHQYDDITRIESFVLPPPNGQELLLPFGSFMNRYFFNKAELIAPYLDNIKPPTAYLDAVIKNYPWRAVKLIFKYVPLAWRVAKKNYLREALKLVFKAFQYLVIPIVFFFLVVLPIIMPAFKTFIQAIPWVGKYLADIKIGTLISILSALNPFILALFKRKRDLVTAAMQKIIQDNPGINIQYVILGHLHLGDRRRYRNCTYYNCGSWTPKIVLEEKLRSSINFTFIRIDKKQNGGFYEPLIQEWNDCAGRFDEVKLYETAESKRQKKIQKRYDSI